MVAHLYLRVIHPYPLLPPPPVHLFAFSQLVGVFAEDRGGRQLRQRGSQWKGRCRGRRCLAPMPAARGVDWIGALVQGPRRLDGGGQALQGRGQGHQQGILCLLISALPGCAHWGYAGDHRVIRAHKESAGAGPGSAMLSSLRRFCPFYQYGKCFDRLSHTLPVFAAAFAANSSSVACILPGRRYHPTSIVTYMHQRQT